VSLLGYGTALLVGTPFGQLLIAVFLLLLRKEHNVNAEWGSVLLNPWEYFIYKSTGMISVKFSIEIIQRKFTNGSVSNLVLDIFRFYLGSRKICLLDTTYGVGLIRINFVF
jgi:hypothetical protein